MWCWVREPDRWVAVLLDRPGSERGVDPRDGGRPLGVGAGLPRRQGGSWSGTATIAPVWANVGAWNLIGWWHTLVELWAWDRPQSRLARPERLAVGQARACVRRTPIAVRSYVARCYRRNIRRYRQWRACARNPPVHSAPHAPGTHEADRFLGKGSPKGNGLISPAESSVCSHPLSMTHPHPLSMAHSPGPMTGLGIRLPNNDATVSFFSSLRFHGKNSWMFSGTLSPAAAQCSKYHVSHFRDSASTATTWRSVFS